MNGRNKAGEDYRSIVRLLDRQWVKFIGYAMILIGIVATIRVSGVMDALDERLLLENTQSDYWHIVNTVTTRYAPLDAMDAENGLVNQIVLGLGTTDYEQGFSIVVNDDGSITYKGTNNSEDLAYVALTEIGWNLKGGSYMLTDGEEDCLESIPVSTQELKLCVYARQYHIGGAVESYCVADASDLEQRFFTTDFNTYNDYDVQLVIAPGYSSNGITIYPMLTTYDDRSNEYHPSLFADQTLYRDGNMPSVQYSVLSMTKEQYLGLSEGTQTYLDRYIKNQAVGKWTAIQFPDGTGIQYTNNDPEQANYGEINAAGQVTLSYGGIDQIALPQEMPLHEITDFNTYLKALHQDYYTVLVAIRDDGISALSETLMEQLEALGVKTNLIEKNSDGSYAYYRNSYYAVLNPDLPAVEEISTAELNYSGNTRDGQHTFTIHSCGAGVGDEQVSIKIDGTEWAMNRRGMNFVVYDNTSGEVIDTVTFDTCSGLRAYRQLGE